MEIGEKLEARSQEEWRAWLDEHHQDRADIWLVLYKSSSGKRGITMGQAQEEALCFGWVDSQMKSIDAFSYALRFSPRRKGSHWTGGNKRRALELLREGKLSPAGIAALPTEVLRDWEEENSGG